jgi:hypothetical protein
LHENFLHILPTLGATIFKPSENEKSNEKKEESFFFVAFSKWIL